MNIVFSEFDSKVFFDLLFVLSAMTASFGAYIKRRYSRYLGAIIVSCSFVLLIVPLGLRTVGIDQEVYREWFFNADFWLKSNYFFTPEPLFAALTIFAKDILNNFQFIYIFSALAYLLGIYYFLEKSKSLGYISIFFMNISLYLYMCGLIRIGIALGITAFAYTKIEYKWRFIIYILAASMFHYTAIIGVLVYLAFRSKRSVTVKGTLYLVAGVYALSFVISRFAGSLPYAIARYAQYVKVDFQISNISNVIIIIPAIALWFMYPKSYSKIYADKYKWYGNIIQLLFTLIILSITFSGMYRLTFYFYPIIAKIYYDFSKILYQTNQRVISLIYKSIFTIIGLLYVYAIFYTSPFITALIIPFEMQLF